MLFVIIATILFLNKRHMILLQNYLEKEIAGYKNKAETQDFSYVIDQVNKSVIVCKIDDKMSREIDILKINKESLTMLPSGMSNR